MPPGTVVAIVVVANGAPPVTGMQLTKVTPDEGLRANPCPSPQFSEAAGNTDVPKVGSF